MARIALAQSRIRRILGREIVAHRRTLEQKISDQGPSTMRVDPHLVGLALMDLQEREILTQHAFGAVKNWYAHRLEHPDKVSEALGRLGPLYASTSKGQFTNLVGDALEVVTYKAIRQATANNAALFYLGTFRLDDPKDKKGRYRKTQPPRVLNDNETQKEADFIIGGYPNGPVAVECKNYREWLYPNSSLIRELIATSYELNAQPLLVHRRMHYSAVTNLLAPAGIAAHESLYQYYPVDAAELARAVSHKRSLGFTDVRATEEPHARTTRFFSDNLPKILPSVSARWEANKHALYAFAKGGLNMAQLYTAIGSPAGGKWVERPDEGPDAEEYYPGYDD